jgi:ubiquinone/menaquinone biosynthesis C-methylase UbiE
MKMRISYPKIWQQEDDSISIYYASLLMKYGISEHAVDWGSKESQELRFKILAEIGELSGTKILDVGCGLADFYSWLAEHGISVEYNGIDITAAMIKNAASRYPELSLSVGNLLNDFKINENEYDYVFASGIFYRRFEAPYRFFEDMISQMYRLCTKGVAFNSLSMWSAKKTAKEFYADPIKIITLCNKITHKIIFNHNYLPNDFTIYLYK